MEKEKRWLLAEKYGGVPSDAYAADVTRLEDGEPLAYVIGFVPFLGARIDLSSHPLIPRPETEWWTDEAIREIFADKDDAPLRILDMFAGSGCIGIALLRHLPFVHVDFAELDPRHIAQIQNNLSLNDIEEDRTCVFASDMFADIPHATYDYIFANPPYIPERDRDTVPASVSAWEPHEALFAGEDGMHFIRPLIEQARSYLSPGGTLICEIDPSEKDAIEALARDNGYRAVFRKDQHDRWRIAYLTLQNA